MPDNMDRRAFLTRSAMGAAAALAVPQLRARGALPGAPAGMFVSLPPWALARNVGWPEQAQIAARAGYKGIDWSLGPGKAAGVEATLRLLGELGLVPTITGLPLRDPLGADDAAFEAQLPQLAEDAAFCQAIGCRRMQFAMSAVTLDGQSKEQRAEQAVRRLASINTVIARHDVHLGVEFLGPLMFRRRRIRPGAPPADSAAPPPVPFVYTLPDTISLAEAAGANIGVTLDAWHWYHSGGTVADIRAVKGSRIVDVHVSDARPMPAEQVRDDMRWMPGEGVIDLTGFFQALKAIGYEGGVSPEVIGPRIPEGMSPDESARLGLAATIAAMKKAGVV